MDRWVERVMRDNASMAEEVDVTSEPGRTGETRSARADVEPVLPDYDGGNLCGVIPGCLLHRPGDRPEWFPRDLNNAERILLLLVDGLGYEQLTRFIGSAPNLATFEGSSITSVAPSTTATALTSLTTGATPLEHGIIGYRMSMDGVVMNTLSWRSDRNDLRKAFPPEQVQPVPPFVGMSLPVLSRRDLESSAFSEAHLRGCVPLGWRAMSSIVEQARALFDSGELFVYAYYDGLDKIAHERGFGPYYLSELSAIDWLVGHLLESLPAGTTIAVTADHGQVAVGPRVVDLPDDLLSLVEYQSGEGRFRWLHCRKGRVDDVVNLAEEHFSESAWIRSKDRILDEKWFGSRSTSAHTEEAVRRMGDVALVPFADISFDDPADSGLFALECRHGSLTSAEMYVPLLARTIE